MSYHGDGRLDVETFTNEKPQQLKKKQQPKTTGDEYLSLFVSI